MVGPAKHGQAMEPDALGLEGAARDELMTAELGRLLVIYSCKLLVLWPWVLVHAACSVGGPTLPYRGWLQILVDVMMAVSSVGH